MSKVEGFGLRAAKSVNHIGTNTM